MAREPVLLSGGNPQIAKGHGHGPVLDWIAAAPGWKGPLAARIDALAGEEVAGLARAVKWNSPLYGVEGQGWFLSLHCFTRYLKLTFFHGAALVPPPPGASTQAKVRALNLQEDSPLDEAQLRAWLRQAAALPGERM